MHNQIQDHPTVHSRGQSTSQIIKQTSSPIKVRIQQQIKTQQKQTMMREVKPMQIKIPPCKRRKLKRKAHIKINRDQRAAGEDVVNGFLFA
jgi:hypothetical protein